MDVIKETPPPLPPKTKKPLQLLVEQEPESKSNTTNACPTIQNEFHKSTLIQNGFETVLYNGVNNRFCSENGASPPQSFSLCEDKVKEPQSNKTPATEEFEADKKKSDLSDLKNEEFDSKITTWAISKKKSDEANLGDLYENVFRKDVNNSKTFLKNNEISEESTLAKNQKEKKKKIPKIEVRQEDNKTVVKISVKETPTPEEEMTEENCFNVSKENFYENGYQTLNGFVSLDSNAVYENCDKALNEGSIYENVQTENKWCCENLSNACYENVEADNSKERVYANVTGYGRRSSKKKLIAEANYGNLNGEIPECNQVYKSREFQVAKKNIVSIISKNSTPLANQLPECQDKDDELYENIKIDCHTYANENLHQKEQKNLEKFNEAAENLEMRKKCDAETKRKSSVEILFQKPEVVMKVEKPEVELGDISHLDDSSLGDPFDSGTCSDVDSLPTFVQNKKGNVIVTIKTTHQEERPDYLKKGESAHRRAESLTSSGVGVDSEESDDEKSNISCDSLNSNEPYAQSNSEDHGYHTPNSEDKIGSPIDQVEYENMLKSNAQNSKMNRSNINSNFIEDSYHEKPDIIQQVADVSQKIKNLRMENNGVYLAKLINPSDFEEYENVYLSDVTTAVNKKKPAPPPPPPKNFLSPQPQFCENSDEEVKKLLPSNLLRDIRSRNICLSSTYPSGEKPENNGSPNANAIFNFHENIPKKVKSSIYFKEYPPRDSNRLVEERTYEERKKEVKINNICAMEVDTDKFYKFHLTENVKGNGKDGENNEDETFAGLKDYLSREKPAAITSAKGTIRGVKNRVKAGIATFLQFHENKSYKDKDAGKVVVYTTTMGIVRETYHKCLKVKQILRTLMVKFEERDVFMSSEAQEEIRERMKCDVILVPQVFVEGQHIGDAETIERLNEMGELRTILKPYKSADACSTCKVCGGYRLLPCSVCKGSKKSIHRNHFTAEFVALKCMNCDQVGLTKCHAC